MRFAHLSLFMLAGTILLWLARPVPVQAHGTLVYSSPAECTSTETTDCRSGRILQEAPTSVKLVFTEPVKPIRHGLIVTGPNGKPVQQGSIAINGQELSIAVDAGQPGTYQVNWQVISQDSHPVRGNYNFSVIQPSEIVPRAGWSGSDVGSVSVLGLVLQVIGRLAHFAGFALGFGPFFFEWLVLAAASTELQKAALPSLKGLTNLGIVLLLAAEPVGLLGQTASLANEQLFNPDVLADILASSFGQLMTERLGAALLLWILLGVERQSKLLKWGVTALFLALAVVDGQASHAVISGTVWLGLPANTIHLAAMGIWLGGLVCLVFTCDLPQAEGQKGLLIRPFGRVAAICLGWLVVSGVIMSWLRLAGAPNWLNSLYTQTLLVKLLVLAGVIAVAGYGLRFARLRQRSWWLGELGLLAAIITLAGLLISLPPPR